jgi:cellulose synthase/poly-beta-1,6-N-acetylglucosamine synthase-like glycosyltransferase
MLRAAVGQLAVRQPRLSAQRLLRNSREAAPPAVAAALAIFLAAPGLAVQALAVLATLFFVNCSVWKALGAFGPRQRLRPAPLRERELPTYTLLVPLYREAAVVADLVRALTRLDYPAARLQIVLVLEADDAETRAAAARHAADPRFEIVIVPPAGPRTKPKALAYALAFARGELVAVYDAEDRPEPDQLRKAAAAFRRHRGLGCVQARLVPDNDDSWFARMFTLEHAANFEVMLPALARLDVPLPLGGTSNHFPRAVLEKVGGWDPFNVTEDVDLGIRLARFGYRSATIRSRTHEEAPVTFRQWLPQRRRWLKGWMQTALIALGGGVPRRLRLSLRQRFAVHGVVTAGVLGLLLYPLSVVTVAAAASAALHGAWPESPLARALLLLNLGNLVVILSAATVSAARGTAAAGCGRLFRYVVFLPIYWGLMSLAAWQAAFQLVRRPTMWEKTLHGVARRPRPATGTRR